MSAERIDRPGVAGGVWVVAGVVVAVLLIVAGRYGFHRDEMYFVVTGRNPAWAAPDNPMLVPYLAAGWYHLVGGSLWAFRIPPALAMGGYVVIGGLIAREFSPVPRNQVLAAIATALTGVVPPVGHLFSTTTFDLLVSAAALWLLIRALNRPSSWRDWIGFGVLTGVAMEIKVLVALVLACCLAGVLILGPRRALASARPWVAAGIALVLAAPNLIWQLVHGFPQLHVAGEIASGGSTSSTSRALLLPFTVLEIGPIVVVVLVLGTITLLRRPRRHQHGWLALGFLLFVVLMVVVGGKAYYPAAFYPALLAAGVERVAWRAWWVRTLAAVSLVVTACLTLPLFPPGSALFKVGMGPNPDMGETVGWDGYVTTVTQVAAAHPEAGAVLTWNYGEGAALTLARSSGTTLPPVYSGHDAFWYWGPPPETVGAVILVGSFASTTAFGACTRVATLTSPPGVDNEEDGAPVSVCSGRTTTSADLWPQLRR